MEREVIALDSNDYDSLIEMLEDGNDEIVFRRRGENEICIIEIKNPNNESHQSNEKNIVQRWMEEIQRIAKAGYESNDDSVKYEAFNSIYEYCNAVIVSVTSK